MSHASVRLREKLLVLIIVPLSILLMIVGAVARLSMHAHVAAVASQRSDRALRAGQNLLVALVDAETGMRGYVFTGDRRFTEPYEAAKTALPARVAELERAARDRPYVRGDASLVIARALSSFALIDRYVALTGSGRAKQARVEVASRSGKREMDSLRRAVAVYDAAERAEDDVSAGALAGAWSSMYALLATGTLVAIATTVLLYLTLSRSIVTRLQALQRQAHAVATGSKPHTSATGNDEISQVERSFGDMAVLLAKREEALVRANSLQRAIIDGTDHAIVATGSDGVITSFNNGAVRMLGYAARDMVGRRTPATFELPGEFVPAATEHHDRTFVRADGTHVPVSATVTPLRDEAGDVYGYVAVAEDITQRKAAERAISQSEMEQREYASQLRSLHMIANTVATAEKDPVYRSLRLGLEQLRLDWAYLGVVHGDGCGLEIDKSVGVLADMVDGPVPAGMRVSLNEAFLGRTPLASDVYAVEPATSSAPAAPAAPFFAESKAYIAAPIYVSGSLYGALGFLGGTARPDGFSPANREFVRVTADLVGAAIERAKQSARLDELAFFDALTGLPNRVLLLDRLTQTALAATRYNETFALLYLDLDGFKAVNDTYGHGVGDQVLKAASRRFETLMRTSDTVARLGGDEFVILTPKLASALDASDLASRVVKSMHRTIEVGGVEHALSVSIGISVFPHDGREAGTLLDSADRALYQAKARGKNTFTFAGNSALTAAQPPERAALAKLSP